MSRSHHRHRADGRTRHEHESSTSYDPYTVGDWKCGGSLTWPRQIPIEGEPDDVAQIVANYSSWLAQSDVPKLFVNGDPALLIIDVIATSAVPGRTRPR